MDDTKEIIRRLEKIEYQVTQTNSRVKKLELWQAGIKGFLTAIAFAASLPGLFFTVLLLADKI